MEKERRYWKRRIREIAVADGQIGEMKGKRERNIQKVSISLQLCSLQTRLVTLSVCVCVNLCVGLQGVAHPGYYTFL